MAERLLNDLQTSLDAKEWTSAVDLINANEFEPSVLSQLLIGAADFQAPPSVFQAILAKGADINAVDEDEDQDTCLHVAVLKGLDLETIKFLLESGARVSATNAYGETPLHQAIQMDDDSLEVIRLLIKYGADVNIGNEFGETPFHFAVKQPSCSLALVQLLIEAKGNLSLKTDEEEDVVDVARRRRVDSEVFDCLHDAY